MGNSVKNWDDGEPLEGVLPVVNLDFNGFLHWDDWGSLERSLPVVKRESFKNWDAWGALGMLATGSEWGILSKIVMIGSP